MKFIVSFLLTALLSFVACLYFPWWSIAVVAFIIAIAIQQTPGMSFIAGFFALLFLWGGLSFWISSNNGHLLAHKTSSLIFKTDSPGLLILVTAIIGALVAGFAAMTGTYLLKLYYVSKRKDSITT
ncbi:MAG: hypothetical protein ABIO81_06905 [Ginsengibacter sp.]